MPEELEINNVWATTLSTETLTLPSGQVCVARKIDMTDIMSVGLVDQFDTLTASVMKDHVERVNGPQDHKKKQEEPSADELVDDPEVMKAGIYMLDKLIPCIVVKPTVHLHFRTLEDGKTTEMIPAGDREDGVIYTDRIGLEDKAFLFNWAAGGLPDISFRAEPQQSMGTVADIQSVQNTAIDPVRNTPNRATRRNRNRSRNRR